MIGTRVCPASCLMRRAASKPSITGISASISTSCGCSCWNKATASRPLAAVSTRCPWRLTMVDKSMRSAGLSSAIRTVSRLSTESGNAEQLLEVGNGQDLAYIGVAVDQPDICTIAACVVTQQQQHAKRRAVEVGGITQVDHVALGGYLNTLVGIAKLLMSTKIETSLDTDV